ncbi:putative vesicular integral-membrane protein VIP36 [Apostichopus japonicus]|uniref:Putative vesicular integral-membrane protein VIP36 n=1 Tax=Stichopus japonicus TaxID=307972 RepID=A0A2G8L3H2_STIJA|nr:putative vesicular integral-membrane protein VIP36 [Apostichopus japonicus]
MAAYRSGTQCLFLFAVITLVSGSDEKSKNPRDYLKKEHSLMRPYTGAGASLPMWDIQGNTMVTNSYIRLTPDKQSRQGAIWNKVANRCPHWEMHVHFKVHGQGRTLFGDGFALWYTKERMKKGDVFGGADYHTGLGLFFDTYSNHNGPHNHQHPYISAQINNGTLHYDHDRDGTHTELAGCHAPFRNKPHDTHIAMRYYAQRLTVMIDIDGQSNWKECFDVDRIRLPTGYFFGASAITGDLADNHDIVAIKVFELTLEGGQDETVDYADIVPSADFFAPPRDHVDDPQGAFKNISLSWRKMFLITFCVILGALVCVIVGFLVFRKKQDYNKKRFY